MRKEFFEDLKGRLRAKLVEARADGKYSQDEMAEALDLRVCRTTLCDGDVHLQLRPAIPQE